MTRLTDLFYIIHGSNAHTWWRRLANGGYPWWRRWSLFSYAVRKAFERECEIREFRWSGHNTHQARLTAGADLAGAIGNEDSSRRVHLVGHSHGGNVALTAVNKLPPMRITSLTLLANPNITVVKRNQQPQEWLYWGKACEFVPRIWNLYSPEDFVQSRLAQWFHGVDTADRNPVVVRSAYDNRDRPSCRNGEIHWKSSVSAHRSMHSEAMGTVVGKLARAEDLPRALKAAGLSEVDRNDVRDRGGWPGRARTFQIIREIADPRPFDLGNRKAAIGVLFVHGLTASPAEMRPMAEAVVQAVEWRCVGPLLPGHGTRIEDLQQTNGEAWIVAVEHAYEELSRQCNQVFLAGLSLGAVLASHLALRRPGDPKLCGMILMAPAFGVTPARALGVHVGRLVRRTRNKGPRASDYFLDNRLYSYLQIPLNLAAELIQLGKQAAANMSRLRDLPVMMFVGERESTVSLKKMLSVAKDNPWIRLVRLPRSRHILTVEPDSKMMFEASIRFMEECVAKHLQGT